jgi:hypothetical protein
VFPLPMKTLLENITAALLAFGMAPGSAAR